MTTKKTNDRIEILDKLGAALQLRIHPHPDTHNDLAVFALATGAGVNLSRDDTLALYHWLGDRLIATRSDTLTSAAQDATEPGGDTDESGPNSPPEQPLVAEAHHALISLAAGEIDSPSQALAALLRDTPTAVRDALRHLIGEPIEIRDGAVIFETREPYVRKYGTTVPGSELTPTERAILAAGLGDFYQRTMAQAAATVDQALLEYIDEIKVQPTQARPDQGCPNCGSLRIGAVSLDGGWTRRAQCVPCGHVFGDDLGGGWRTEELRNRAASDPRPQPGGAPPTQGPGKPDPTADQTPQAPPTHTPPPTGPQARPRAAEYPGQLDPADERRILPSPADVLRAESHRYPATGPTGAQYPAPATADVQTVHGWPVGGSSPEVTRTNTPPTPSPTPQSQHETDLATSQGTRTPTPANTTDDQPDEPDQPDA